MDKVKILKLAKWLKLTKEIKTDEGVVLLIAGDIAVGEEVFVADESGNMIPAPDGTYTSEGKIIVVAAGKITEVKEVETPAEETPAKENAEEETPAEDPAKDEVETLKARIAELEAENEELKAKIKEYEEKTPAAPSIEEEEKKEKKFKKETSEEKKEMSFREKLLDYAFKSQN